MAREGERVRLVTDRRHEPRPGCERRPNLIGRGVRRIRPDPLMEAFRKARITAGLSQEDLAERTGYGRDLISDWERGAVVPGLLRFREICEAVGIRISLEAANV